MRIYNILPEGRANGISAEQIMRANGIISKRQLSAQIRKERLEGFPIIQINGRYFRSREREDFIACCHEMQQRGLKTLQVSRKLFEMIPEQSTPDPEYEQLSFDDYLKRWEEEAGEA